MAATRDVVKMLDSDSETDRTRKEPPHVGSLVRRKTTKDFDPGATSSVSKSALQKLQGIISEKIKPKIGTYKYEGLASEDEIRILRLLKRKPGDGPESRIACLLLPCAQASSNRRPSTSKAKTYKYEALSYWWGIDQPRNKIWIQSFKGRGTTSRNKFTENLAFGTYYIRSNLLAALQQIRSGEKDIDIWVDALCIDQNNPLERTAQVSKMHEIYNEAENVCIWLGAGKPETKETFEFLKAILDLAELDRLVTTGADFKKWWLIINLMKNKWFSRRWVIQELALAKKATVLWGDQEMQWVDFADAIALFMTKHDKIKELLRPDVKYPDTDPVGDLRALGASELVHTTSNLFRKSEDGKILQRLLTLEVLVSSLLLAFEATEKRDTIYAVLSIAQDTSSNVSDLKPRASGGINSQQESNGILSIFAAIFLKVLSQVFAPVVDTAQLARETRPLDPRIQPDYEKCLTDVCADFMHYCIEKSHSLDILCRHWAPIRMKPTKLQPLRAQLEEDEDLPSWIPSIEGHAYGRPKEALEGRKNGDSFVGTLERKNRQDYHASGSLFPLVEFGKYESVHKDEPEHTDISNNNLDEPQTNTQKPASQGADQATPPKPKKPRRYDGKLYVKGQRLGEIIELSGRSPGGLILQEALAMGGWPLGCEDDKVPEKLWRSLVADRGPHGTNAPSWYHRACLECLGHCNTTGDLHTDKVINTEGTPTIMVTFLERVQRVIWNRRFFLAKDIPETGKMHFGLTPSKAEKGDIICIFYGCSVPVLLREKKDTEKADTFSFIGECYVHGMMDGEAIPVWPKLEHPYIRAETFTLV